VFQNSFTKPAIIFFSLLFGSQFVAILYSSYEIELPPLYSLLEKIAFLWVVCSWVDTEMKQTGRRWSLDVGLFLSFAWLVLIPIYLVKTRGMRGLIGIAAFIATIIAAWIAAAFVITLFLVN